MNKFCPWKIIIFLVIHQHDYMHWVFNECFLHGYWCRLPIVPIYPLQGTITAIKYFGLKKTKQYFFLPVRTCHYLSVSGSNFLDFVCIIQYIHMHILILPSPSCPETNIFYNDLGTTTASANQSLWRHHDVPPCRVRQKNSNAPLQIQKNKQTKNSAPVKWPVKSASKKVRQWLFNFSYQFTAVY